VVRAFAEPAGPYGPGHRGADLGVAAGTVVRAANDGVVTFAGEVAGSYHVVVGHDGGLRTSYSYLAEIRVARGDAVRRGTPLGITGGSGEAHQPGSLHLGLRAGDTYLDPMLLFGPPDLTLLVRLVPHDLPPGRPWDTESAERAALNQALHDGVADQVSAAVGAVVGGADAAGGWAADQVGAAGDGLAAVGASMDAVLTEVRETAVGSTMAVARYSSEQWARTPNAIVLRDLAEIGDRVLGWWRSRGDCTKDAPEADGTGGSGHRLLAVAGINSSTGDDGATTSLDVEALGYDEGDVSYYSYAADRGAYDQEATWGDLMAAARRLGAQLRELQRIEPGREVDLIAHSQGGVVIDLFLQHVYRPGNHAYPPIGTVVTLASPHEGAPLATVAGQVRGSRTGRAVLEAGDDVVPLPPADSPAVQQLAEDSRVMRSLWDESLPWQIDYTTIGGSDDIVVPATNISVPDATEVTVDVDGVNDHSAIPTDDRALRVVRSALEGLPPPCIPWDEGVRGAVEPVVISRVEHTGGDLIEEVSR